MPYSPMLSSPSLGFVLLLPAALYLLILFCYRIWLHPLAKYPGPWLGKMTGLYMAYHALKGDCHLELWRCHEKYGRIIRIGPNSLSFNSSTALREIYGHKANLQKSDFYTAFWATGTKDTASTHSSIDKSMHARKRRVLGQGFSDTALKSMERYVLSHIRQFCESLRGSNVPLTSDDFGEPIDVAHQSNYLTFDVMGDLCFGKSFGMLDSPENRFAIDLIANATHRHYLCGIYPKLHRYRLDKILFPKIAKGRARFMQYSKKQATTRMESDADRKDFFYHLLNARDPETGEGFSKTELWGESNSLMIAGSDTTSTAYSATMFYLLHNPRRLERLSNEIRSAFSDVEDIQMGKTLSQLRYLRACIDEALRMAPPVGGLLPRETVAPTLIDGETLPPKTTVGVPHYALHHNEIYYPDPFEYKPERWLASEPGSSEESVAGAQSAFCPFSIGPRACIGKGMAYHELTLALGRTIFLYDMRLAPGTELVGTGNPRAEYGRHRRSEYQLKDTFTSVKEGPIVQFRPRC